MKANILKADESSIKKAIRVLRKGGIIIFPTDTVYGIGCDINNSAAIKEIYRIKQRKRDKPLVMFLSEKSEIKNYVKELTKSSKTIIEHLIPGPLTLIFKAKTGTFPEFTGRKNTISVRVPDYPLLKKLIKKCSVPLATTSVNVSGGIPAETHKKIGLDVDLILTDDNIPEGTPSTVLDISRYPPILRRKGALSIQTIEKYIVPKVRFHSSIVYNIVFVCTANSCRSPMAEGILKSLIKQKGLKNVSVSSCGTIQNSGFPATPNAILAISELGYSIRNHRSKSITKKILKDADLFLCMENLHKRHILKLEPNLQDRTFLLTEFAGKHGEILDPIGQNIDTYRKVAGDIQRYVKRIVKDIALRFNIDIRKHN